MRQIRLISKPASGLLTFLLGLSLILAPNVHALEIVVSENGSGSTSEATVETTQETQVTQTNEAEVENTVQADSNTGGNEASGNTGGSTTIETGDTKTNIDVENSVNSSSVTAEQCCVDEVTAKISGNGSDSENEIDLKQESNVEVNVNQSANIQNNIQGTVNTGNNKANDNTGGSVSIKTGDIKVNGAIVNGPVNTASVSVSSGFGGSVSAVVSGNGSGSKNEINAYFDNPIDVYIDNVVSFKNWVDFDLNTGGNEANGNTGGDVSITTGDIDFDFLIKNMANIGGVDIDCCPFEPEEEKPEEPGDGEEKPKDGEKGDDGNGDGNGDGEGQITPEAAATVGGPGIIGLSDTSSPQAQSLFFMLGLFMIALGVKYIGESLSNPSFAKRKSR